ncbi:glycosyltransferase family 2 protein [Saccharospirillum sp. HFRX-1]|uniref:glycosyltransferase family 2 protein n=1 Tax=unclassified Saccharospirillum TaxID=2633430 RepID=UPI0037161854
MGVVITTYNSPLWLEKVLAGYECQSDGDFETIIADDGSDDETRALIEQFRNRGRLNIRHVWHEDNGFRKTEILNKAIKETSVDYLIFTDGDCIPRADFIAVHRQHAKPDTFLSGGYLKLTMPVSQQISIEDINQQRPFDRSWLLSQGQPKNHKLWKLVKSATLARWLNRLTPAKASWNGMNSSTWRDALLRVNGFDERMQYGGLDRELGERLWNLGFQSQRVRYQAICLHLDHKRGYSKPEIWARNNAIRADVRQSGRSWTPYGIVPEEDRVD